MTQLRIPGPTPCPDEVLQAMGRQMVDHRSPAFKTLLLDVTERLKTLFMTKTDLFIFSGSGTGGLEAGVVNVLSPGDRVLSLINGVFGARLAAIAEAFGAQVERLTFPMGIAVDPEALRDALKRDGSYKAVCITHNETSTGVTNDLATLCAIAKEFGQMTVVDAVSSIGALPLPTDEWQVDVCITGSQKGWMVPPGLAMVSYSEAAWKAHAEAKMPRFFWDITAAKRYLERGETPWTPAVTIFYALEVALRMMEQEGLPQIHARHQRVGARAREGAKALGLELLVSDERYASNTVTAIKAPEGVNPDQMRRLVRDEYDVWLAGGQGELTGKLFRIGHLGFVEEADIDAVLEALRQALPRVGFTPVRVAR